MAMIEILPNLKVNFSSSDLESPIKEIFTPEAANFFYKLHQEFNGARVSLLAKREARQKEITAGKKPDFLKETESVRTSKWKVAECPADLQDRRVEITGPVEAKMMINALNSGAKVFMADIEDALSPTWENVVEGQIALKEAVRRTLAFTSPEGKSYKLNDTIATLLVRPRGWHLEEKNVLIDGKPVSASILDFALYFFHNTTEAVRRGTGPYFYLPKMESHLEARLWNDIFNTAQGMLGVPRGTIRATVLIETILAAYEMDEILFELKDHMSGLNAGRWDYMFSAIKKFRNDKSFTTPDRAQLTMTVPFMRAYTELLVQTCHKRGAHAIGGMAAFIPSRKDVEVNKVATAKVTEDKNREVNDGFDGTWVAHPDLVVLAKSIFDAKLGTNSNQKSKLREEVSVKASDLINFKIEGAKITENGLRQNINVSLQYIERWLAGVGAAGIHNLMEDAATAEISRAQLWQWVNQSAKLDNGTAITADYFTQICNEELKKCVEVVGGGNTEFVERFGKARMLLNELVLGEWKWDFLTLPAYQMIQ